MCMTRDDFCAALNITLARRILSELAEDKRYGCYCGEPPYTDGDTCPKCAAIDYAERYPLTLLPREANDEA